MVGKIKIQGKGEGIQFCKQVGKNDQVNMS